MSLCAPARELPPPRCPRAPGAEPAAARARGAGEAAPGGGGRRGRRGVRRGAGCGAPRSSVAEAWRGLGGRGASAVVPGTSAVTQEPRRDGGVVNAGGCCAAGASGIRPPRLCLGCSGSSIVVFFFSIPGDLEGGEARKSLLRIT